MAARISRIASRSAITFDHTPRKIIAAVAPNTPMMMSPTAARNFLCHRYYSIQYWL
jgi:hypothetical protein